MTAQLSIAFEPRTHVRRHDPATSRDAAKSAQRWAASQAGRVYAALEQIGPAGKTRIAASTGLTDVQVARRLADLEYERLAIPLDQYEMSSAGKSERRWAAL